MVCDYVGIIIWKIFFLNIFLIVCSNSNVHRAVHYLAEKSTQQMTEARRVVQSFLNARVYFFCLCVFVNVYSLFLRRLRCLFSFLPVFQLPQECIFVKGTTEGINLVAYSYLLPILEEGDIVVLTQLEHHANIVPWQTVCSMKRATIRVYYNCHCHLFIPYILLLFINF
jgi:cysteine desulfurase/selenocysteine lyase